MQESALQNLTHLLSHTFSSQFVFPVLGHDDPGSKPGERLGFKDVAQLWKHWLPSEAILTFNKGKIVLFKAHLRANFNLFIVAHTLYKSWS
jgi:hypothetical protein